MLRSSKSIHNRMWAGLLAIFWLISLLLEGCGDVTPLPSPNTTALPATIGQNTTVSGTTRIATPTQTANPTGSDTPTVGLVFPALANIATTATALRIQDTEQSMGYSSSVHYLLDRQDNGFTGSAYVSLANGIIDQIEVGRSPVLTQTITIPAQVAQDFLQSLPQIPIERGAYEAFFNHSDDYPAIGYQIDTPAGTLSFFTSSQNSDGGTPHNDNNLPWGAYYNNQLFIIKSPIAAQALEKLKPYLHKEILGTVLTEVRQARPSADAGFTPTSKATMPAQSTVAQLLPALASLPDITTINLNNDYNEYNLISGSNQYTGEAVFYHVITSKKIAIPNSVIHAFLQELLQVAVVKNTYARYTPLAFPANYHRLSIDSIARGERISLYFDGQAFSITSATSEQIFAKLQPYFEQDTIDQLGRKFITFNGPTFSYPKN